MLVFFCFLFSPWYYSKPLSLLCFLTQRTTSMWFWTEKSCWLLDTDSDGKKNMDDIYMEKRERVIWYPSCTFPRKTSKRLPSPHSLPLAMYCEGSMGLWRIRLQIMSQNTILHIQRYSLSEALSSAIHVPQIEECTGLLKTRQKQNKPYMLISMKTSKSVERSLVFQNTQKMELLSPVLLVTF